MKAQDAMTRDPVCCLATDSAQTVAGLLRKHNVGSMPVVTDHESRRLIGIITDRDLCCSVVADGVDARSTPIGEYISRNPAACREGESLDSCERLMQERQVRRIPIVDGDGQVIGIVSQADLALKDEPENVARTVTEVSKPRASATIAT